MSSLSASRRIVMDDAIPHAETLFGDLGEVIRMPGRDIDRQAVRDADALIVRSRTQINAELLSNSKVRFVGSTVVGLDHVDQTWLEQAGIHFYSAQGCNANAVAEYVIANIVRWAAEQDMPLQNKTLAIIGVGHVGRQVHAKAQALGLRCLLNDPPRAAQEQDFPHTELNTCLQEADFITLHTPLTASGPHPSCHLLNRENMRLIRPNAVLINAARGGIVDETAWLETETAADIIDCWEAEPTINPALYRRAWLATPHIAGHSLDAKLAGSIMTSQALRRFWQASPLSSKIDHLLPAPSHCILPRGHNLLTRLNSALCQAWDFRQDHDAIAHQEIKETHKKFEYYRRHYPDRREWHAHLLTKNIPQNLHNLLKNIGFQG